jgi:hypothetical protein
MSYMERLSDPVPDSEGEYRPRTTPGIIVYGVSRILAGTPKDQALNLAEIADDLLGNNNNQSNSTKKR